MSNTAASMFGFFSTRIAIDSVFGMLLDTPTGTTAPFSAMSGVDTNAMSLLCAGALPPSAFIVSSSECVSNAALFHAAPCASASPGLSQPAAGDERQQARASARLQHFPASCIHVASGASHVKRR
jgi:hypothetical protein